MKKTQAFEIVWTGKLFTSVIAEFPTERRAAMFAENHVNRHGGTYCIREVNRLDGIRC